MAKTKGVTNPKFMTENGLSWKQCRKKRAERVRAGIKRAVKFGMIFACVACVMGVGTNYAHQEARASVAPKIDQIRAFPRAGLISTSTIIKMEKREDVVAIVSFYTASPDETDDTPCQTADMTYICPASEGIMAANWLPMDTKVEMEGKTYRVADRMNARYSRPYVDILVDNKEEARQLGRQNKIINILN